MGNAWVAGAVSQQSIAFGDGFATIDASNTTDIRMFGLGNGDSSASYNDIEYAIYLYNDGSSYIYESGNYIGRFDSYSTGDTFKVAVESGVVNYYHNAHLEYTSAVVPSYPLLLDTSIFTWNGTIDNAMISGNLSGMAGKAQNGMARLGSAQKDQKANPAILANPDINADPAKLAHKPTLHTIKDLPNK